MLVVDLGVDHKIKQLRIHWSYSQDYFDRVVLAKTWLEWVQERKRGWELKWIIMFNSPLFCSKMQCMLRVFGVFAFVIVFILFYILVVEITAYLETIILFSGWKWKLITPRTAILLDLWPWIVGKGKKQVFKWRGCLRHTESPFLGVTEIARVLVTDALRYIDMIVGAERGFYFPFEMQRKIIGLEERRNSKIWKFGEDKV